MRVRERIRIMNGLEKCHGCGRLFALKDRIYVEENQMFGLHPNCIPRLMRNTKETYILSPLDSLIDAVDFLYKLTKSKKSDKGIDGGS